VVSVDAPPDPFDVEPRCTTDSHWKMGYQRSPLMFPGMACTECHMMDFGTPPLTVAGTVYATGHEPDNCNGAVGAIVEITGANGLVFSLETNSAGNFMWSLIDDPRVVFPISARVINNGNVRAMMGTVMTGDCNTCHTQDGVSSAPGRIVLP
jgi:hypothetical protein